MRSGALDSEFNTSAAAISKCLCDETDHSYRGYSPGGIPLNWICSMCKPATAAFRCIISPFSFSFLALSYL